MPLTVPPRPHAQKLPLAAVIALEPVGLVVGGRTEPIDDDWGGVEAVIHLDGAQFGPDAVAGLDLHLRGLDAVDGSPVLDVKPFMREFEPSDTEVRQPAWSTELMRGYY